MAYRIGVTRLYQLRDVCGTIDVTNGNLGLASAGVNKEVERMTRGAFQCLVPTKLLLKNLKRSISITRSATIVLL